MLEMEDVGFSVMDFVCGRESGKREMSGVLCWIVLIE